MKISKLLSYLFLMLLIVAKSVAQQDPQYTHYMYNMSVINPAYATQNKDILQVGGLYRTQWVGAVGAPKTVNLFAHLPVNNRVEVGMSIVSDEIGDVVKENNLFADFAYVIPISEKQKLSFGLKGGLTFFNADFNGFQFTDAAPDPAFAENINQVFPNIGAGTYFFGTNYYLGLSAPNLLQTKHLERGNGIATIAREAVHYFLTGGYVFDVNPNLRCKPAFMAKGVTGAPMAFDITTNLLFYNKFELGMAYRINDAVSGLANFYITPTLRIGYAYDYTVNNLGNFNSGTHEIFMLFDLDFSGMKRQGYDKSPRFF